MSADVRNSPLFNHVTGRNELPDSLEEGAVIVGNSDGFPSAVRDGERARNVLTAVALPLQLFKKEDLRTRLATAGDKTNLGVESGTQGTNAPMISSYDSGGLELNETMRRCIAIPSDYAGSGDLYLAIKTKMELIADVSCTIDVQAFQMNKQGALASTTDLCTTAAQSVNGRQWMWNTFVINGDTLNPGDMIDLQITTDADDDGDAGANINTLTGAMKLVYYRKEINPGSEQVVEAIAFQDFLKTDLVAKLAATGDKTVMGLYAGTHGTHGPYIVGADLTISTGTTESELIRTTFPIPSDYVPGTNLELIAHAGMITTACSDTMTLDLQAFKSDEEGLAAGTVSDLCETTAMSINDTSLADYAFVLTGSVNGTTENIGPELKPGDLIDLELTTLSDTSVAVVTKAQIGHLKLRYSRSGIGTSEISKVRSIPLDQFQKTDLITALPSAGDNTYLGLVAGTHGVHAPYLAGTDSGASTKTELARIEVPVPADHVAGTDINVQVHAKMEVVAAGTGVSAMLDVQAYESDEDGTVTGDICTSAAQSINKATWDTYDFTLTGTLLAPGDIIDLEITTAVTDGDNAEDNIMAKIGAVDIIYTGKQ